MNEYPVIFKCSECTIEAANLDFLESHIWSRHLRCFPYKCSICSYPALNQQSLAIHFQDEHYEVPDVEFKRKISDEVKLREIIAASIVVPVFEEEEQIYDDQNQVPQVLESVVEEENALTDSITIDEMEVVDSQGQLIEGVQHEDTNGQVIYVSDKGIYQNYDKNGIDLLDDQEHDLTMQMDPNGQVVGIEDDNDDLVECEDDDGSYAIYSGHELLDETYQYIDADGNNVYVSHEYPHSFQSKDIPEMPMRQVRAMKSRHMDAIVNQVSKIQKNRRATTFWQCPECGKVIRYPSRIEAHRRQHRGEKPYSCRHCDQKFAQKGALKCHERLHSGERPYSCTWECGKTFVSASAQRMHEKLHSGERPFACNQCGRLFGKKSHLIRHEEGVHNIHTIEPHRSQPRGLEAAGKAEPILKNIVEEIVEGVRHERHEKQLKHREND